jgi:Excinuclease ATPase subunit
LPPEKEWISLTGAKGNNLKNIDVTFPKGRITCVTGVSGSGKSTLTGRVIIPAVENRLDKKYPSSYCRTITGTDDIKGIVYASQSPIGRSSRSTIATYIGLLDEIRPMFAATEDAKEAKLSTSAFSFNSKEGQCDACNGEGEQTVAVAFAADIHTTCPVCGGKRYKKDVLKIHIEGKSIYDILCLSVQQATSFFMKNERIMAILDILCQVGLGYLGLNQSTSTLSGGEAQRIKLAKALTEKKKGKTLYVLDEPTSGLHFSDIQNLLSLLARLADEGHTILVIEHNLDVIRNADWIIDLGPEGGIAGGQVLVQGTQETVKACKESYTGAVLAEGYA